MAKTKSFFPEFVPNQVLTDTQLNQLRIFLDEQNRSTRFRLVGTGIVCGLEWSVSASNRITICEGFGVSSDGHLIELEETSYTHFRPYVDPDVQESDDGEEEPAIPEYEPWRVPDPGTGQIDLLELIDEDAMASEEPPADAQPLANGTGAGRVLVLYIEMLAVDLKSCLVTDCDNKGKNVNLCVRALLVREQDLQKIPGCGPRPEAIHIPRIHTNLELDQVVEGSEIDEAYAKIVSESLENLLKAIEAAFETHGKFLGLRGESLDSLKALLEFMDEARSQGDLGQYHYDILKDLATAYNEAIFAACELVTECCPESDFPRHLMLGAFDGEEGYRNLFMPSPVRNVEHRDLQRVRKLFLRVLTLARKAATPDAEEIRITPSHTELRPLGERAVPFYYTDLEDLSDCWQPRTCCSVPVWSYHAEEELSSLDFDYGRFSFMRIEGHVGQSCEKGLGEIRTLRSAHNLEFDLLQLDLTNPDEFLSELEKEIRSRWLDLQKSYKQLRLLFNLSEEEPEIDQAEKLLEETREQQQSLLERLAEWSSTRCSRRLYCDASHLESDYLALRSEVLCLLANVLDSVAGVAALSAGVVEDPDSLQKLQDQLRRETDPKARWEIRFELRRLVIPPLLRTVVELRTTLSGLDDPSKAAEALRLLDHWNRVLAALEVIERADTLRESSLPKSLCGFNYPLFLELFHNLQSELASLWLWSRAGASPESSQAARWLAAIDSCVATRLGAVFFTYQKLREGDLGHFANFAHHHNGLEHLAGVEKGGTFILVCENDQESGRIVADFTLSGQVKCCCDVDLDKICLPPEARLDARVVELTSEDQQVQPFEIDIDVLRNDFDPNLRSLSRGTGKSSTLRVELAQETSELGAALSLLEERTGVVRYSMKAPFPGALDRFDYTLRREGDEDCRGEARGEALVLMKAEIEAGPGPEDPTQPGQIVGRVVELLDGEIFPIAGATVTLVGTNRSTKSDDSGEFLIDKLNAGTYTVRASASDFTTAEKPVVLKAGGKAETELQLSRIQEPTPSTGSAIVFVIDARTTLTIPGATVTAIGASGVFQQVAGPDGRAVLTGLLPGEYTLEASAPGFLPADPIPFTIVGAAPVTLQISLRRFTVPDITLTNVTNRLSLTDDVARALIETTFSKRFSDRFGAMKVAGETPSVASSVTYKAAGEFVRTTTLDPDLSDEEVIKGYRDVSKRITATIKQAAEENKETYRDVLSQVSLALLDRLTMTNPENLGPEAEEAIGLVAEAVKSSEVDIGRLKSEWNSAELESKLAISSAAKIAESLG